MIQYVILAIFSLLFTYLTWRNFNLGLILLFFLLPSYMIRFQIGPIPTTLLEIMLLIIAAIWLIKYQKNIQYLISNIKSHKSLFIATTLFIFASTISIFTSVNIRAALGEWKAFYVEPIILFVIIITTLKEDKKTMDGIIYALVLSGLVTSLLAIYQHFTGWMVPWDFWQNRNTFRVTAWYGFPNAVGLFLAPIIPLAIYLISNFKFEISEWKKFNLKFWIIILLILMVVLPILAIIFAKSTGALVGLAAGLIFFLFFYNKKTRIIACLISLIGIIGLFVIPTNNSVKQEILMQDRSGKLRLNMWAETTEFLKTRPIVGAGLASYAELIQPYRINKKIEVFHHPHNLFSTMWVNLGLLGLFAFVWILVWFFKFAISNIQYPISTKYITTSMIIILVMGLVDSPYIKNDLSIFFWLLPALLLNSLPLVGGGQERVSKSQQYEQLENNQT